MINPKYFGVTFEEEKDAQTWLEEIYKNFASDVLPIMINTHKIMFSEIQKS